MYEWIKTLDGYLKLSGHEILTHVGKISAKAAKLAIATLFLNCI